MGKKSLLGMCCVCENIRKIVNNKEEWLPKYHPDYLKIVEKAKKEITHTYCPPCYKIALKELEK